MVGLLTMSNEKKIISGNQKQVIIWELKYFANWMKQSCAVGAQEANLFPFLKWVNYGVKKIF